MCTIGPSEVKVSRTVSEMKFQYCEIKELNFKWKVSNIYEALVMRYRKMIERKPCTFMYYLFGNITQSGQQRLVCQKDMRA